MGVRTGSLRLIIIGRGSGYSDREKEAARRDCIFLGKLGLVVCWRAKRERAEEPAAARGRGKEDLGKPIEAWARLTAMGGESQKGGEKTLE